MLMAASAMAPPSIEVADHGSPLPARAERGAPDHSPFTVASASLSTDPATADAVTPMKNPRVVVVAGAALVNKF